MALISLSVGPIMWPTSRLCIYTSKINGGNFEQNNIVENRKWVYFAKIC